jgi:sulfatase maturation enzyme AslB (radical SAM superfamily)
VSKFQKLEFYAQQRPYELLPFKFDRLNDDEYVITNMAGEFHVIPVPMLEPIISKTLPLTSELIPTLRSKQFIRFTNEQAPLQLLALKIRTRLSRLAEFTNLHIFVVTLRCDHSCPYCQVSRQSESKGEFDMTTEMADKSLDFVFMSPNPAIKIEFQGGEPLLNFEMVRYVVLEAKNVTSRTDVTCSSSLRLRFRY